MPSKRHHYIIIRKLWVVSHRAPVIGAPLVIRITGKALMPFGVQDTAFEPDCRLVQGILPFAVIAGFFGLLCPVLLFGMGSPHLPAGLSTVMAAAELPAGLFIAMVVLGEQVPWNMWAGILLMLVASVVAIIIVLIQPGNSTGIDALGGSSETFFGKNKGRSLESKMKRWTVISLIVLSVLAIAFFILQIGVGA